MARQLKEYIVILTNKRFIDTVKEDLEGWGVEIIHTYKNAFPGFHAKLGTLLSNWIKTDPRVKFVEEIHDVHSFSIEEIPLYPEVGAWHLDRIDQRYLPLSGNYTYTFSGAGTVAYIIDSGAQFDHEEFGGRIHPVSKVGDPNTAFDPFIDARLALNPEDSASLNAARGFDENGHGTHVAGIIGSITYGAAKNVTMKTAKVFGSSGLTTSGIIISGIDAVLEDYNNNGNLPSVVNMSFGGSAPSSSTVISTNSSPTFISGETIFIDGNEVLLSGTTVADAINSINNANIPNIVASTNYSTLKITKTPGLMVLAEGNG